MTPQPDPIAEVTTSIFERMTFTLPTTFVPVFAVASLFTLLPLFFFYMDDEVDYTSALARGLVVGTAAAGGVLVLSTRANPVFWFNMMLFFHIGVEVKLIDTALTYAFDDDTSDAYMAWSLAAAIVIIVHLLPFLLVDGRVHLLTLLAYAGINVNVITSLYLDPNQLLLVSASSVGLLVSAMSVCGCASVFGLLRAACRV